MARIWLSLLFWLSCIGVGASDASESLDSFVNEVVNQTLLDVHKDLYGWENGTLPKKYLMNYFELPVQIDKKFLSVSADFDLTPFNDTLGVWAFPHTIEFGKECHAYFTKSYGQIFFDKVEIRAYLHGDATLLYFNISEAVNASATFKGNGENHWQVFDVKSNKTNKFRLEIHTSQYGDFGLLDRVTGFYTPNWPPPDNQTSTEKPADNEQETEPSSAVPPTTETTSDPENRTTPSNPGTTTESVGGNKPGEPVKPSNFAPNYSISCFTLITLSIFSLML